MKAYHMEAPHLSGEKPNDIEYVDSSTEGAFEYTEELKKNLSKEK